MVFHVVSALGVQDSHSCKLPLYQFLPVFVSVLEAVKSWVGGRV